MRVLLVQPPLNPNVVGPGREYLPEPVALELLAANLPNHEVFVADLRVVNNLDSKLVDIRPDLVGITCSAMTEVSVIKEVSSHVKRANRKTYTVVGGQHPTFAPQDFTGGDIDFIVFGEGERTLRELVDTLAIDGMDVGSVAGIGIVLGKDCHRTATRALVDNIDLLPTPDRNAISEHKHAYYHQRGQHVTSILTSRGCPYRCSFCSIWRFYRGTYRQRSPESICAEIESLSEGLIHFADDTFLYDTDRSWRIVKLLSTLGIQRKYKFWVRPDAVARSPQLISAWVDIGLATVCVALESPSSEELRRMGKGTTREINDEAIAILKDLRAEVVPSFVVSPDYDEDDFDNLANYISSWGLHNPVFSVLTPLPGTELYEQMKGRIIARDPSLFDLAHPVVETYLPYDKFMNRFLGLYEEFYRNSLLAEKQDNPTRMPRLVENDSVERVLEQAKGASLGTEKEG